MANLSASAIIILNYAESHKGEDGFAELGEDIGLSEDILLSACNELKSAGYIKNFAGSEDSVEYVQF